MWGVQENESLQKYQTDSVSVYIFQMDGQPQREEDLWRFKAGGGRPCELHPANLKKF